MSEDTPAYTYDPGTVERAPAVTPQPSVTPQPAAPLAPSVPTPSPVIYSPASVATLPAQEELPSEELPPADGYVSVKFEVRDPDGNVVDIHIRDCPIRNGLIDLGL